MLIFFARRYYIYYSVIQLSRAHREHYCDKTGTIQKVDHFQLPAPVEDAFKKDVALYAVHLLSYQKNRHSNCMSLMHGKAVFTSMKTSRFPQSFVVIIAHLSVNLSETINTRHRGLYIAVTSISYSSILFFCRVKVHI